MLNITCLLWGDNPSQGFMVNLSPKDTIYNLKQKIVEYLDLGNNISRKMKLLRLREFITLDDIRLKQRSNPKFLFNAEELNKPFQILDDYFASKDEDLKEFPLDIIILINNENHIATALDRKEKEDVIMAPHRPIATVIRESTLVNNSNAYLNKKHIDIDPSLFPSPPVNMNFDPYKLKGKIRENYNYGSSRYRIPNYDNDPNVGPRTKSIIFNIDRFPSPPDDNSDQYVVNNNDISNSFSINNSFSSLRNSRDRIKQTIYDLDQFPDAPMNEDFSFASKVPITSVDEAPPSYETINKNINMSSNDRNNIYSNTSMNQSINQTPSQYEMIKKDKKSVVIRKSILISFLIFGVMISSFMAVVIAKVLIDKGNEGSKGGTETTKKNSSLTSYTVGYIRTITTSNVITEKTLTNKKTISYTTPVTETYTTSILEIASTTLKKPTQTPDIEESKGGDDNLNNIYYSNVKYRIPKDVEVSWKVQRKDSVKTDLEIKKINNNIARRGFKFPFEEGYNIKDGFSMTDPFSYSSGFGMPGGTEGDKFSVPSWNAVEQNWENYYNPYKTDQKSNNETVKAKDFKIDGDLSLNLTIELKRIIEIDGYNTTNDKQNVLIISPKTEVQIEDGIQDNSYNVGGGIVNIKRLFQSSKGEKQVEVEQRLHICRTKCTSKMGYNELDPSKLLYTINLKKWDYTCDEPIIKLEFEVTSSKHYWSNESLKIVNFDKGQCILKYFSFENNFNAGFALPLSIEKIKDVYTNEEKSLLVLDMFMASKYAEEGNGNNNNLMMGNPMMPKPENKAVFSLQSDMNNYNLLDTILSSPTSTSSGVSFLNHSRYYLWFTAFIIFVLHYFIL